MATGIDIDVGRRKAMKYGANGSTVRAYKPGA